MKSIIGLQAKPDASTNPKYPFKLDCSLRLNRVLAGNYFAYEFRRSRDTARKISLGQLTVLKFLFEQQARMNGVVWAKGRAIGLVHVISLSGSR